MVIEAAGCGRSRSWRGVLAVAVAIGTGAALAQARAWVGEIQPLTPAALVREKAGASPKAVADRDRRAVAEQRIHKPQSKTRIKRQAKAKAKAKSKAKSEAQLKLRATPKVRPKFRVSNTTRQSAVEKNDFSGTEARWQEIQTTLRPAGLIVLCEQFARDFPTSPLAHQVGVIAASARHALDIQRSAGLSGDFFEDAAGDSGYRENLRKAVRGDKEAAYGIALAYKNGTAGVDASSRRKEQWLHFSAELGSGEASWELAEIYNRDGLVADAARFEKKALDLGYRPPPRLPTRGY